MKKTVAVIGGGASGMMAALTAAEDKNNQVVLFERQARVGRKLLSTGNGRCNLTNTGAEIGRYHGEETAFMLPAMSGFSPEQVVEYFSALGLVCTEQYGGRVYPLSDAAGSVLDVLRFALDAAGVDVRTAVSITGIRKQGEKYLLTDDGGSTAADAVIIACGGMAGGKLGGVKDGYELLAALGHRRTKLYPALMPVFTGTDYPRSLKGVRAEVRMTLHMPGGRTAQSRGELQFVEKGISGPATFDISRCAAVEGGKVVIDLLPPLSAEEVEKRLRLRCSLSPEKEAGCAFAGMLHSRLGMAVVKYAGIKPSDMISSLTEGDISRLADSAKNFTLPVTGTDSFENAQVTAGGIATRDFDPETLESRLAPGVFACGEVLDIDGDCGGFNLQWAWASGRLAGRLGKK